MREAAIVCLPLGAVVVERLDGVEGMHRLPRWTVVVVSEQAQVALSDVLGACVQLTLGGGRQRALMVIGCAYLGAAVQQGERANRYQLTLSSPLWALTQRRGYRVYRNQTAVDIIRRLLEDAGFGDAVSLRLSGTYQQRPYTVQYDESAWAFITRLLREAAVTAFIDERGDVSTLVLTDHGGGHDGEEPRTLRLSDAAGMNAGDVECLYALERRHQRCPTRLSVRAYDVHQPGVAIEAVAGGGDIEVYEYARVPHQQAAEVLAAARLRQHRRDSVIAVAKTRVRALAPGDVIAIVGVEDEHLGGEHLVVGARHQWVRPAAGSSRDDAAGAYEARVRMLPFDGRRTYPPPPPSPSAAPRVGGVQSAQVTGPEGEEVHTDALGRIKVRLPFDRSERTDDSSSDWVRCMQCNMDGAMQLPRVGWEVALLYEEGEVDAPFSLGRLYHGASPLPYELPAHKTAAVLQSATSPAGDGGASSCNELRMEDGAGRQEMMVHASADHTLVVGADAAVEISGDQVINAATARKVVVAGSQSAAIGGSQSITVAAAAMTTHVSGARDVTVAADEHVGTDLSRTETVDGAYVESIAGVATTRCNAAVTSVKGALSHSVGAAYVVTAGCAINELVGGARTVSVGGAVNIKCGRAVEDTVGLHRTAAASFAITAGGSAALSAKAAAQVEAASSRITAAGTLLLEAPAIAITAGSVALGASLKLSGSHSARGAKVTVKAPMVNHAGGTKVKS